MEIEARGMSAESVSACRDLHAIHSFDQSGGGSLEGSHPVAAGVDSLAVSEDVAVLQLGIFAFVSDLTQRANFRLGPGLLRQFGGEDRLVLVEGIWSKFQLAVAFSGLEFDYPEFRKKLLDAFEYEPLEDGYSHPAEDLVHKALSLHGSSAEAWIRRLIFDTEEPTLGASVLRCLGRLASPGTASWRAALIHGALKHADVEVRDAAVQAVELWAEAELIAVLRDHQEAQPWLREYAERVICDLTQ